MALVGGASGALLQFLEQNRSSLQRDELILQLTNLTVSVLSDSNDSGLLDLLQRCGWDITNRSYDPNVDIENLSRGLAKLNQRRHNRGSTLRASHVGIRNTIKSFAPDMLMKYTLEKGYENSLNATPSSIIFEGVCLLADISGFTRLSGQFCDRGKDGIDQLQQATNGYMGQLVKVIYAYGGDVMKFAGDALVCIFTPNKHTRLGSRNTQSLRDVCANAVQCGFELAQVCTEQLTAHVAVSCGTMCFATLGGYGNMWECLVSGECLGHLSQCLDDAPSKHTVITQQCVDILGTNYLAEIDLEHLHTGNYRVLSTARMNSLVTKIIKRRAQQLMKDCESRFIGFPNDSDFLTAIGRFVPTPVSMGLLSGNFDYLAELREVTTMFMKWDSYDEVTHKDLLTLQPHFFATQKVLAESGAFVRQFLVDDKGCVLIACWGVPTASYPDNARRALCSAVIIGAELKKLGMKTSFGITTGNVFCGSVGSFVRREYAVIGDVVNLSARLMGKAKGGCLVSEVTYNRLPPYLRPYMEKLEPMAVKGKDLPITPYKYSSPDVLSLDESTYNKHLADDLRVRSLCKKHMVDLLDLLTKSREKFELKFLLFEGGPGTGKQEAVEWMKQNAPKMDVRVIAIRLSPKDSLLDFGLLSRLFRLLVGEDIFDHPDRQQMLVRHIIREVYKGDRETISRVAMPAMRTALGVTCSLGDVKVPLTAAESRIPPRLLKQSLHEIFMYLFNEGPVAIIVEDVHFSDLNSWNALLEFRTVASRAFFLLTQCPPELLDAEYASSATESSAPSSSSQSSTTPIATGAGRHEMLISPTESLPSPEWFHYIRKKFVRLECTVLVQLSDLTVAEVGHLICTVLNLTNCPVDLAEMVHKLSGGNPYWCREMALFIQGTGADEFMRAMEPGKPTSSRMLQSSSSSRSALRVSAKMKDSRSSSPRGLRGIHAPMKDKDKGALKDEAPPATMIRNTQSEWANSERVQAQGSTTAKLELFIVCRFEKLSTEDQSVLRTASIIGSDFSREILYGILSPKMRTRMSASLQSLVRGHWIKELDERGAEYTFTHAMVYQTLYDLTPTSDKARLHFAIASYLEDAYEGQPLYYASLGHHYGLSHDCHAKALEFTVRAAAHRFESEVSFMDEALMLITESKKYAEAAVDFASILGVMKEGKERLVQMKKALKDAPVKSRSTHVQDMTPPGPVLLKNGINGGKLSRVADAPAEEKMQEIEEGTTNPQNDTTAEYGINQHQPAEGNAATAEKDAVQTAVHLPEEHLTLRGVMYYLSRLQSLEDEMYESYERAVELNNIGIIAEWMKPFLQQRRKTLRDSWAGRKKNPPESLRSSVASRRGSGVGLGSMFTRVNRLSFLVTDKDAVPGREQSRMSRPNASSVAPDQWPPGGPSDGRSDGRIAPEPVGVIPGEPRTEQSSAPTSSRSSRRCSIS